VERVVVIGNSGGGKSVLARKLAQRRDLPYHEIDAVLWQKGWRLTPQPIYDAEHARLIGEGRWVIDGLGRQDSIATRLARATEIVLIDMPLWTHFWLAAERHLAWTAGRLEHPPAGMTEPPPLEGLFRTIAEVDREWMPEIRRLVAQEEGRGKVVRRVVGVEALKGFVGE